MSRARRGSRVVVSLLALLATLALPGRADAGKPKGGKADGRAQEVRDLLDKATGEFALNHFAAAAESYEKAFALKPDPAVLYNAAQAHRLAGNKERALDLYQSYLRMYGTEKRAEIEKHVSNLKEAIEKDRAVATSPPRTPAPVGGTTVETPAPAPEPAPPKAEPAPPEVAIAPSPPPPAPALNATQAPAPVQPAPVLVAQAAPPPDDGSLVKKPWFWIAVGGAMVAAGVVGFLLFRPGPSDPTGSLQPASGN